MAKDVITVNSSYQLADNKPLDAKLAPVKTISDLNWIPRAQRYEGMTICVLNYNGKGDAADFHLVGGTANNNWKRKDGIVDCGEF